MPTQTRLRAYIFHLLLLSLLILQSCEVLETSDYKDAIFQVRIGVQNIPDSLRSNDAWTIRYTMNDSTKEIRADGTFGGTFGRTFLLTSIPVSVSAKTGQLLTPRYPNLSSISVFLGNRLLYQANLKEKPLLWQDWTYRNTANINRSAAFPEYTLELNYTTFTAFFIVENRDTLSSYRFRYTSDEIQKDSIVTIPRGYSARIVRKERALDFDINLREQIFSPERFLTRYMRGAVERNGQFISIPFGDWSFEKNNYWLIRYRIFR